MAININIQWLQWRLLIMGVGGGCLAAAATEVKGERFVTA